MCAPDEIGIAMERIAQNNAAYDRCMIQKDIVLNKFLTPYCFHQLKF